jgi:hypothetical protein
LGWGKGEERENYETKKAGGKQLRRGYSLGVKKTLEGGHLRGREGQRICRRALRCGLRLFLRNRGLGGGCRVVDPYLVLII